MKKYLVLLLSLAFLISCGKDEPTPPPTVKENLKIEGKWGFEKLNFLDGVEEWPENVDFSMGSAFGWAPVMFSGIQTFDFQTKEYNEKGVSGKVLSFSTTTGHGSGKTIYWVWDFRKEGKSFEITQINKQMPPYDFSLSEAENIVITGGKLNFTTTITSRIPGGGMTDYIKSKVEITLTREQEELTPQLYIKGKEYSLPKEKTLEEKLLDTKWKLKPGSEIYNPGFVDQDPKLEYRKLIAFHFAKDHIFFFRYSFPMGIVLTKERTWEIVDGVLKFSKEGNPSMGTEGQAFEWKIISVNQDELIMEEKESKEERTFIKIEDIDDTTIKQDDYKVVKE